jgi:hypothetical protein
MLARNLTSIAPWENVGTRFPQFAISSSFLNKYQARVANSHLSGDQLFAG